MGSKLKIKFFLLVSLMSISQLMAMNTNDPTSSDKQEISRLPIVPRATKPPSPYNENILIFGEWIDKKTPLYLPVDACTSPTICKKAQTGLCHALNDVSLFYAGAYITDVKKERVESHMLKLLDYIDLEYSDDPSPSVSRMYLMENIIKTGSIEAVKKLTGRLLAEYPSELADHNNIMKKEREYDRPIFWLAAIVTRCNLDRVSEENYRQIEHYLCELLCPMDRAVVNGKTTTRAEYVAAVNRWKEEQNKLLGKQLYHSTQ